MFVLQIVVQGWMYLFLANHYVVEACPLGEVSNIPDGLHLTDEKLPGLYVHELVAEGMK